MEDNIAIEVSGPHTPVPWDMLMQTVYVGIILGLAFFMIVKLVACCIFLCRRMRTNSLLRKEEGQKQLLRRNMIVGYKGIR